MNSTFSRLLGLSLVSALFSLALPLQAHSAAARVNPQAVGSNPAASEDADDQNIPPALEVLDAMEKLVSSNPALKAQLKAIDDAQAELNKIEKSYGEGKLKKDEAEKASQPYYQTIQIASDAIGTNFPNYVELYRKVDPAIEKELSDELTAASLKSKMKAEKFRSVFNDKYWDLIAARIAALNANASTLSKNQLHIEGTKIRTLIVERMTRVEGLRQASGGKIYGPSPDSGTQVEKRIADLKSSPNVKIIETREPPSSEKLPSAEQAVADLEKLKAESDVKVKELEQKLKDNKINQEEALNTFFKIQFAYQNAQRLVGKAIEAEIEAEIEKLAKDAKMTSLEFRSIFNPAYASFILKKMTELTDNFAKLPKAKATIEFNKVRALVESILKRTEIAKASSGGVLYGPNADAITDLESAIRKIEGAKVTLTEVVQKVAAEAKKEDVK